jgi:ABC-type antimicrobial peptide transport system permease subunit
MACRTAATIDSGSTGVRTTTPLTSAMALTLAGLAIGLVLAAIAARLMTTLFYGFRPDYVPAVAVVSLVLLAVAALACLVPARRAPRIDPMLALQHE